MNDDSRRAAAICTDCGNVFAVQVRADGTVRPIGTGVTCSCGSDSFDVLDGTPTLEDGQDRTEA
ncbi:hypothetical protein [Halobiforma nitratireducens]|uniref:Uncharacterized protein n=1 Tax=Halobiforma nitratireducens JCM 10879 TaxID=1227454 RepID=M0M2I6_9EURY|nr:hypothetical protein [Halobiforma nitratireducens]EMA38610.1 hypothetical protein C446_09680 [Halobiforma nitratireducens JCM 10879]